MRTVIYVSASVLALFGLVVAAYGMVTDDPGRTIWAVAGVVLVAIATSMLAGGYVMDDDSR